MAKKATMANLPVEIITDILLRLPIKTLCGLKCVCKSWRALISTPRFTKSHQKQSTNTHVGDGDGQLLIRTESLFTVSTNELLLKPPPLTKLDALHNRNPNCFMNVVGSSGGLLCLLQYPNTFFLLNPTTRESITLRPDPDYPVKLYGFGYVSLADDYKVIKVATSCMVRVYSTKTNSWKRVKYDFPYSINAYSGKRPACVDGMVHWLVYDPNTIWRTSVVGFDFNEETFKEIPLPDKGKPMSKRDIFVGNLGVLRGLLCISFEIYPERLELWLMLEYGVRESWNKIVTLPYYLTRGKTLNGLLPLGILSGQLLLQLDRRFLFLYDQVKVKFEHLKLSLPQGPCCKFGTTVYDKEEPCCAFGVIVYEKSLVSPRGYFWLDESSVDRLEE